MALVVEVLSKNGKPLLHQVVEKNEISVGRSYDSDVRMDDPYVCSRHALLKLDESTQEVSVRDCSSLNGLKINNRYCSEGRISSDDILTLGRTRIRVFAKQQQVLPTLLLSKLEENIEWLSLRRICALLLSVFISIVACEFYFNSFNQIDGSAMLKTLLTVVATFSIWPLTFALLAKLSKKDTHIISQFSLIWIVLILLKVVEYFESFLIFNLDSGDTIKWLALIIKGGLFAVLLWFSLFLGFHQSKRIRNALTGLGITIVAIVTFLPNFLNNDRFKQTPTYQAEILAPTFRIGVPKQTKEFISDSQTIFDILEQEIKAQKED